MAQPLSFESMRYEKAVESAVGGNDIEINQVESDGTDIMKDSEVSMQISGLEMMRKRMRM